MRSLLAAFNPRLKIFALNPSNEISRWRLAMVDGARVMRRWGLLLLLCAIPVDVQSAPPKRHSPSKAAADAADMAAAMADANAPSLSDLRPGPAGPLPNIFGLQLGAPVTLPECKKTYSTGYDMQQAATCQGLPGQAMVGVPDAGYVIFPADAVPTILGMNVVITTILDGKLESLNTDTLSYKVANYIVDQLTVKFGKPTISATETVEIDNIAIPSTWARWDRPGYLVEYHAIRGRLDGGSLTIETDKARAAREAEEKTDADKRTPL